MAILEIIKDPNPILRKKAKAVKKVTKEITDLINDMEETMRTPADVTGVGLAAPQVGKSLRVIVVDIGEGLIEFINPKIVSRSGKEIGNEGCLSVPGVCGYVERALKIKVKGLSKQGAVKVLEAEGFLARVLQHEIDHLDGVLFIDKVVHIEETEKGVGDQGLGVSEKECQQI